VLLREAAGVEKGANDPGKEVAGKVTDAQIEEIAKIKMPDLNAYDLEAAKLQIAGTARSMGLEVG
jgi:large subunit ribosomal protein L11